MSTVVNLIFIPGLYVLVNKLRAGNSKPVGTAVAEERTPAST